MIVPDVNLLVYAHNEAMPQHARARAWFEEAVTEGLVGLPWVSALGFVRLSTHPSVMSSPLPPLAALEYVEDWLARETVRILEPGPRHLSILRELMGATNLGGSLTTDTHLAAIAIEHQCELHSNDADFRRFPGLRWRDPLA